jgi:hypothetical protein
LIACHAPSLSVRVLAIAALARTLRLAIGALRALAWSTLADALVMLWLDPFYGKVMFVLAGLLLVAHDLAAARRHSPGRVI